MSWDIIERVAGERRYTRTDAEEARDNLAAWRDNIEGLLEQVEHLANLEIDPGTLQELEGRGIGVFTGLSDAATTIGQATSDADALRGLCEEFIDQADTFTDAVDVWIDPDEEREARADAKESMTEAANQLIALKADLGNYDVDPEAEG